MVPFPDPSRKHDALAATYGELPRIRSTGLEVGPTHGLGSTIYGDNDRDNGEQGLRRASSWGGGVGIARVQGHINGEDERNAYTAATRLRKDGKWLGELDLRRQLSMENPLLKR